MAIANGTYEILPLLDVTMAMDVYGNSTANKANVRLYGRNGANSQKWAITTNGGISTILDAETGKSLDVANGTQAKGTNVWMYTHNNSAAQRFVLTEDGTQTINGTAYPVVKIGAFGASSYVLDCAGGKSDINTNIQIWTSNNSAAQRFVLVPTEWLATTSQNATTVALPTPANGRYGWYDGGLFLQPFDPNGNIYGKTIGAIAPVWLVGASISTYQVRYRTRTRLAGAEWLSEWSSWKSIADDSTGFDGWGTVGAANVTAQKNGEYCFAPYEVSFDNSSTYDRTDIQFSVRCWSANWGVSNAPAHGGEYTWTVTTLRQVAISTIGAYLTPDGIQITYDSTGTQDGNAITVESSAWGTYSATGPADGSVLVPNLYVTAIPKSGDQLDVTLRMTTPDGLAVSRTVTATVAYEGTHGSGLTLSATVSGTIATVTANVAGASAWLMVEEGHGTRFVALQGQSPWKVAPPLGVPWKVYASATTQSGWTSTTATFDAISDDGYHITSQDLVTDLAIVTGSGAPPTFAPSYSRDADTHDVLGRERPIYVAGSSTEQSWEISGVVGGGAADMLRLADWALHAGHVYFRGPRGFWAQALVLGGKTDLTGPRTYSISLSLRGEVW